MNLDELRSVQSKERQTDSLQHLRESFYADVSAYVSDLEDERDRVAAEADDPYGHPEVRRLTDEIETAREVVEAIYDRRLGKLVKRATLAAADMPADDEGLTAEERELFEDLVGRIEDNKARVLEVVESGAGATDADDVGREDVAPDAGAGEPGREVGPAAEAERVAGEAPPEPDADPAPPDDAAAGTTRPDPPEHGSDAGGDPAAAGTAADPDSPSLDARTTVRITGDVDEFYGVDDREYDLEREEVVTLPAANAEPLLQSGDAERLD